MNFFKPKESDAQEPDPAREEHRSAHPPAQPEHSPPPIVMLPLEASAPLESSLPLIDNSAVVYNPPARPTERYPEHYSEPSIEPAQDIAMTAHNQPLPPQNIPQGSSNYEVPYAAPHQINPIQEEPIRLLEERLRVNYFRRKVGEVIIRKQVETHMVEVPVRREMLIVEQISPENKQLASVDLGYRQPSEAELAELTRSSDAAGQEVFIPIAIARRILQDIAEQSGYQQAAVKLTFEDPHLQDTYQQWLTRYLESGNL